MVNFENFDNSFGAPRQELLDLAFALRTDSGFLKGNKAPPAPTGLPISLAPIFSRLLRLGQAYRLHEPRRPN